MLHKQECNRGFMGAILVTRWPFHSCGPVLHYRCHLVLLLGCPYHKLAAGSESAASDNAWGSVWHSYLYPPVCTVTSSG